MATDRIFKRSNRVHVYSSDRAKDRLCVVPLLLISIDGRLSSIHRYPTDRRACSTTSSIETLRSIRCGQFDQAVLIRATISPFDFFCNSRITFCRILFSKMISVTNHATSRWTKAIWWKSSTSIRKTNGSFETRRIWTRFVCMSSHPCLIHSDYRKDASDVRVTSSSCWQSTRSSFPCWERDPEYCSIAVNDPSDNGRDDSLKLVEVRHKSRGKDR